MGYDLFDCRPMLVVRSAVDAAATGKISFFLEGIIMCMIIGGLFEKKVSRTNAMRSGVNFS